MQSQAMLTSIQRNWVGFCIQQLNINVYCLDFVEDDLKFTTECFFLTMQTLRLGLNATIESFKRVRREANELHDGVRQIERQINTIAAQNPVMSAQFQNRLNSLRKYQKVVENFKCSTIFKFSEDSLALGNIRKYVD
jgi:hypothetical protein